MKLISSYPRSGSAKLRMIICNLLYPEIDHDFTTINQYVPSIDSPITRANGKGCDYMVTHMPISSDIYLYRHIGDCLISEYWFKQKFYPYAQTLEEFIIESNYGEDWRKSVEAGRSAEQQISFDQLNDADFVWMAVCGKGRNCFTPTEVEEIMEKSSFKEMFSIEIMKGLDTHLPESKSDITYMRSGKSGQWKDLNKELAHMICNKNEGELEYLGLTHWDNELGEYIDGPRKR